MGLRRKKKQPEKGQDGARAAGSLITVHGSGDKKKAKLCKETKTQCLIFMRNIKQATVVAKCTGKSFKQSIRSLEQIKQIGLNKTKIDINTAMHAQCIVGITIKLAENQYNN